MLFQEYCYLVYVLNEYFHGFIIAKIVFNAIKLQKYYTVAMRYMGIDYGAKRVGIAVSDEKNNFAIPHSVLLNDKKLADEIKKICTENDVGTIVLGESKNFKGEDNLIMGKINSFKEELASKLSLSIMMEPEFMTSAEATHLQGENKMIDASAASLILKSYLSRITN